MVIIIIISLPFSTTIQNLLLLCCPPVMAFTIKTGRNNGFQMIRHGIVVNG